MPVEFFALHYNADEREFYYDGEELQQHSTDMEERLHLHKAHLCVQDWIRTLQHQQLLRGEPLQELLHDQQPLMAAAREDAA